MLSVFECKGFPSPPALLGIIAGAGYTVMIPTFQRAPLFRREHYGRPYPLQETVLVMTTWKLQFLRMLIKKKIRFFRGECLTP